MSGGSGEKLDRAIDPVMETDHNLSTQGHPQGAARDDRRVSGGRWWKYGRIGESGIIASRVHRAE